MTRDDPPRTDEQAAPGGGAAEGREAALKALNAEWHRRLACLNNPDFAKRVDAIMDSPRTHKEASHRRLNVLTA